jgi:hypothetical protein
MELDGFYLCQTGILPNIFAMLGIVPEVVFHLTRATQGGAKGSPQVWRVLRSDDDKAAIAATISRPGAAAHSLTNLGTAQGLVNPCTCLTPF